MFFLADVIASTASHMHYISTLPPEQRKEYLRVMGELSKQHDASQKKQEDLGPSAPFVLGLLFGTML